MIFTSATFVVFLAAVLVAYRALPHRAQNVLLLVASYVFYGWWDWRFCSLLALSTVVDFTVARLLSDAEGARRNRLLAVSLVVNLGILATFKYLGFFAESLSALADSVGLSVDVPTLEIVLPVGISFYTFQTLAYTIDVYRRRLEATDDLVAFAVYVAYFPQLVAGPIERAQRLLPQILAPRRMSWHGISTGALLFGIGLVRKVVVADGVAPLVDQVFADPTAHPSSHVALGVFLFGVQIYGDFAGYSDMARGVSRMLGIELVENFQRPYFATNITEFWRRWHVSLSQWLRDYLYIPLGGNRRGRARTYVNLFATMFLGGLWHGAAWTFVVWGVLHGAALAVHKAVMALGARSSSESRAGAASLPLRALGWAATMTFVWFAWVFFRAEGFANAADVLSSMTAGRGGIGWDRVYTAGLYTAVLLALDVPQERHRDHCAVLRWPAPVRGLAYAVAIVLIVAFWRTDATPFIYFQF